LVGPKGSQISGGQKQRIAIARAIINDPRILLLDEATSALDARSEAIVQESLQNITSQNNTSLIIAHRLSTIKNVDEILVFHNGKIVERGGFDDLMRKKQYFFKLAEGTGFGIC
jgi:ATP-binding cassette subfamily B (MDR/TAP) protein 1